MKIIPKIKWHRFPKDRTPFERFLRKFILPDLPWAALQMLQWERHDRLMKALFPIRWFIFDTMPSFWRSHISGPWTRFNNWFRYRIFDRYHVVVIDTEPGYMDPDERMLRVNFQILVDFVEIELASFHSASLEADNEITSWSNSVKKLFRRNRRRNHRDPEGGMAYLDWEISVTNSHQARAAAEKKDLYLWWTVERPNRFDLYTDPHLGWNENKNNSDYLRHDYTLVHSCETIYEEQDQEMLIRLMKVRRSLWT